jgi:hypothetical protein
MALLKTFSRSFFPGALLAFGASWVALGYLYDLGFMERAFPADASIDVQIQYDRDRLYLHRLQLVGLSIFALGAVASIGQVAARILSGRERRSPSP